MNKKIYEKWNNAGKLIHLEDLDDIQLENALSCTYKVLAYFEGIGGFAGLFESDLTVLSLKEYLDILKEYAKQRDWTDEKINALI